jgi:hypothetical protein
MAASTQKTCPKCGKPLTLALPPGARGERVLLCLDCDGVDPLRSDAAKRWVDSPLKPPAK